MSLFPFADVRDELRAEILAASALVAVPMPADKWVCRSLLQKACRRGELHFALRAARTLLAIDSAYFWRTLTVIALEDLGPAGLDITARILMAAKDARFRAEHGERRIASALLGQMCASPRCQSVCDLLLRASHDPTLETAWVDLADCNLTELLGITCDHGQALERRAVAVLMVLGELPSGLAKADAAALFHTLGDCGEKTRVADVALQAWRLTRNSMAALLPLVWGRFVTATLSGTADDELPPVAMVGEVPGYALDQFTRSGLAAFRMVIARSAEVRDFLDTTSGARARRPRLLGDLVFIAEGGLTTNRLIWSEGERLRLPFRTLSNLPSEQGTVAEGTALIRRQARLIADCRAASLPSAP